MGAKLVRPHPFGHNLKGVESSFLAVMFNVSDAMSPFPLNANSVYTFVGSRKSEGITPEA